LGHHADAHARVVLDEPDQLDVLEPAHERLPRDLDASSVDAGLALEAPELLIERGHGRVPRGRAGERCARMGRAGEPARRRPPLAGAVEGDPHPIEQVHDVRGGLAHGGDERLVREALADPDRVLEVLPR
jgi:hypothetical protein